MDIRQQDARILREFVAYVANHGQTQMAQRAMVVLRDFAVAVSSYCTHEQNVRLPDGRQTACLDCGKRETLAPELWIVR